MLACPRHAAGVLMNKTRLVAGGAVLALVLAGAADAAPRRNDKVWSAVEANRAGALDFLKEIVNIDSGTLDVAGGNNEDVAP